MSDPSCIPTALKEARNVVATRGPAENERRSHLPVGQNVKFHGAAELSDIVGIVTLLPQHLLQSPHKKQPSRSSALSSLNMQFTTLLIGLAALAFSVIATPQGGPIKPCTTTYDYSFITAGPTSTAYETTYTATSSVDCGGCVLVSKDVAGVGPFVTYTTTVTDLATVATTVVCATTAY